MIFEYVNPKAGYFVEKIKEVEYQFRGQYLSQCSGKKKKWNFEKNPLENISLPYEEILNACASLIKTGGYKLRETKKREEFVKDLQNLVSGFLELINFEHLMTQKEKEDEDNKFISTEFEESKGETENEAKMANNEDKSDEKHDIIPKKEDLMENKEGMPKIKPKEEKTLNEVEVSEPTAEESIQEVLSKTQNL